MIHIRTSSDREYPEIFSENTSSTEFEIAIYAVIEVLKERKLNVEEAKEVLKQVDARIDKRTSEIINNFDIDDISF